MEEVLSEERGTYTSDEERPAGTATGQGDTATGQGGSREIGEGEQLEQDIPFYPALARYGRPMLSGMIRGWWRTWAKRRGPADTDLGTQLAAAARASGSTRPTGTLQAWLDHLGADADTVRELTPGDAARWLAVWRHEQSRPLSFQHRRLRAYRGTEALRCGLPPAPRRRRPLKRGGRGAHGPEGDPGGPVAAQGDPLDLGSGRHPGGDRSARQWGGTGFPS